MICQNIEHFHIGWKNSFFFFQDDLVYLSKINVFFKFYKRQPFSVKGMCQLYLFATNLKRQIVKKHFFFKERNKLSPTNDQNWAWYGSWNCYLFVCHLFFFQAAQSIMHYLYFRFWLSTKNCIKILIDISLLFALSLVWSYLLAGEENCKSHQNRLLSQEKKWKISHCLVSSKNHKPGLKCFVRGKGSFVTLCAVTWDTQLQRWLDLFDWPCDPERYLVKPSKH